MLWIGTRGIKMVGKDESTELWRHPNSRTIFACIETLVSFLMAYFCGKIYLTASSSTTIAMASQLHSGRKTWINHSLDHRRIIKVQHILARERGGRITVQLDSSPKALTRHRNKLKQKYSICHGRPTLGKNTFQ